jgi:quinol monooxygenase YgiN
MVRLTVVLHVPTSNTPCIVEAFRTLMRSTRLEPGCIDCQVWVGSVEDDRAFRTELHYEERWISEKDIEQRVRSQAFTKVLEVLEAATEAPQVEFDFVSRQQGLDYVEAVRGEIQ